MISPLLCNVYLHRFDRALDTRAFGVLVRYADDLLVVCKSEQQAHAALARLWELLAVLGLAPKEAKTRIVELAVDAEGFDFLGFHHRMVPPRGIHGRRGVAFLARWTSDGAMARARDRIRAPTHRSRLLLPVEVIVADLNRAGRDISVMATPQSASTTSSSTHVSGSHCSSANAINADAASGGPSWATSRGNFCGLWTPSGTVITPGPNTPWREKPNAHGERRR